MPRVSHGPQITSARVCSLQKVFFSLSGPFHPSPRPGQAFLYFVCCCLCFQQHSYFLLLLIHATLQAINFLLVLLPTFVLFLAILIFILRELLAWLPKDSSIKMMSKDFSWTLFLCMTLVFGFFLALSRLERPCL